MGKANQQLDNTKKAQELFLRAYEEAGTISSACRLTMTPRATVYYWRDNDEEFAKKLEEAGQVANELLIGEARRRAYQGVLRKKFEKGKPLIDPETGQQYMEREYSDSLMMFLIKAKNPEYRDKAQIDLTTTTNYELSDVSDAELTDKIAQLLPDVLPKLQAKGLLPSGDK